MHDVLRTVAAYAARSEGLSARALQRFSRAAASHARTDDQLKRSASGLERSRKYLRSAGEALHAAINMPSTDRAGGERAASATLEQALCGRVATPTMIAPQLATPVTRPPSGPEWVHEISFDGCRLQCRREGEQIWLLDVDGRDWSDRFPSLVTAIRSLKVRRACIDCAAVAFDEDGMSSPSHVQEAMSHADDSDIVLLAFDLLQLEGNDIRALPLLERKKRLRRALNIKGERIRFAAHLGQSGKRVLEQARLLGIDGIVSKRRDAPYMSGLGLDWQLSGSVRRN
jgi:bifunctional non-homologous end joining protein LigD